MRQRLMRAATLGLAVVVTVAFGVGPAQGAGYPGRPDAPPMPTKGEYTWAEPKEWTPPTLEELQKWEWTDGRVTNGRKLAAERYAAYKPELSDAEALALPNDSKAANERILSTLSRPPKSDDEVDWDATVNRTLDGAPSMLNYILYSSRYENYVGLMDTALVFSFDHKLIPFADSDVVVDWKRNPQADMIQLRDDLVWEDGKPFTAYDVEFTYHAIVDERINVPAVRSETVELKWVKAYDERTLVYFHKEPKATNIWIVQFPILPKHIYSPGLAEDPTIRTSEWNTYWNFHPLSSGPYRVVEYRTNESVLLERREDWYQDKSGKVIRDKPYVKTMRCRVIPEENAKLLAFKKGDIDEFLSNPTQYANEMEDQTFRDRGVRLNGVEWGYRYIGWNQKPVPDVPYFKDKRVRLAMGYALNHKELIEKLTFGLYDYGAGPFHPQAWMADPTIAPLQQDLDKAESLLDEAGWKDSDGDGVRDKMVDGKLWKFEFTAQFAQGSPVEKVLILLKEDLEAIGVKMNLKGLEFATLQQSNLEHRFEASAAGWGSGADPDTAKNLWTTAAYDNGRNWVGYSNPEVDRLFGEGAKEFDPQKRAQIYQKIDRLIWDDQPYTWVYYQRSLFAFSRRLRGYNFSPRDPFSYKPGFLSVWVPKQP